MLNATTTTDAFLIAPEMEVLKQGLKAFFDGANQIMAPMQVLDPIFLGVEVERKGQAGSAKGSFERPSMCTCECCMTYLGIASSYQAFSL